MSLSPNPSCVRLLHQMVHDSTPVPIAAFMNELCALLAQLPILIVFETQIRIKLLFFLQLVAKSFPELIERRCEVVLLLCELQYWFRKSRARLRSQPFYSMIDAGTCDGSVSLQQTSNRTTSSRWTSGVRRR